MTKSSKLLRVTIDNITIEVEPGTTVLQAARMIGGDVVPPAMCYYTSLKDSGGNCRTCLVKVSHGSADDPRPLPKLMPSCRTIVIDGMVVESMTNPEVLEARKGVVEFLLINHPLDCPVCDQAGECDLQDLSYENGTEGTRYEFERRTFEKHDLGPYIQLHMTRCILCYRCVYVADQLTNKRVHGVLDRGDQSEIATYIEKSLDNDFIGNVIDVCSPNYTRLLENAYMYLNSPYLWGGRSPFGIDCSGFTQMVFKLCGISLPRDTGQQVELGVTINLIEESKTGDLVFFDNAEGKISHVGIIIPGNQIIHASGKVRIDRIDHQGIYNDEMKNYSHNLRVIKRIF